MSDSQRPKLVPATPPSFEVPDLELEPRSIRQSAEQPAQAKQEPAQGGGYRAPNLFEEDSFQVGSLSLDFDAAPRNSPAVFGPHVRFEDPDAFELESNAQPNSSLHEQRDAGPEKDAQQSDARGGHAAWPTGRAPDPAQLELDSVEIAIVSDYGDVPRAAWLTPAYAYRVFTRQRELKRQLIAIAAECERAQFEREATLSELARAVRPAAEKIEQFRRLFAPLLELEQLAAQREKALSSVNQQLNAQSGQFDAELAQTAEQVTAQRRLEQDTLRAHDEREATAKRADAKLKRVHIEIRAVTQVVEQKLGPAGGQIPDAEAAQLATLRKRAEAIRPEVELAQAELAQAKAALGQVRARLDALRQSERLSARKKQALGEHYQKELQVRSQGLSESETQQRAALADLGRALLGAAGSVEVGDAWLERVRGVSERADKLILRRETQLRAIDGYDQPRARQGVRLACTVLALFVLLILFKLIF